MPIPIILAALAKAGLTGLASAVLAKGQEVIEDKLGVSLEQEVKTEEGLIKLKQLEFEHQEFLINAAQAADVRDLDYFKEEVAEKNSARARDAEFIKAGKYNIRADVMFILAIVIVCALVWMVWKNDSINEYLKGIVTLVLGRFLGYIDNIYNFEFGTTRSSRQKDNTIEKLSGGQQ